MRQHASDLEAAAQAAPLLLDDRIPASPRLAQPGHSSHFAAAWIVVRDHDSRSSPRVITTDPGGPTPSQAAAMRETLERLRELYNAALEEWRDAHRKQGIRITKKMQDHQLKELRQVRPEYDRIHAHLQQ
ncbi:MAG: helix-turn-helix domain-containing protein, partial [Polyangiales bacterium]